MTEDQMRRAATGPDAGIVEAVSYVFAVYRGRTHSITTGRVPSNDAWILAGMRTGLVMRPRIYRVAEWSWGARARTVQYVALKLAAVVRERDANDGAGMSVRATWGVSRTGQVRKGV